MQNNTKFQIFLENALDNGNITCYHVRVNPNL